MDFSNRSSQSQPGFSSSQAPDPSSVTGNKHARATKPRGNGLLRWSAIGLLFAVTILIASVLGLLYVDNTNEGHFVSSKHYQAVFLTNGQVYFGHIKSINNQYFELDNIYYLQSSSTSSTTTTTAANNNVTLIKLGCELHSPYDQMIINASQISFWENIQDSGQVGKGIAQLKTCTQSASPSQSSSNAQSSTQNPATTDTTKKP